MRKFLLIIMLVVSGMTGDLFAQNGLTPYGGRSKTDMLFDVGRATSLRHHFIIGLKNSNRVQVQVTNKAEFEKLLNLDSIIRSVAANLVTFKDSLQDEMVQKRIDYLNDAAGLIKVRIKQYPPNGTSYVLGAGGPALLKIEQDTLNIIGYREGPANNATTAPNTNAYIMYHISILINDINKLESLADGKLNEVMNDLKGQWDDLNNWSAKKDNTTNLSAYYSTADSKFNIPIRPAITIKKWSFRPYIQVGLQNVNNILTGSAGAGFEIVKRTSASFRQRFQLIWEPYFFFEKQPDNKFNMNRNDFLTFQFLAESTTYLSGGVKVQFNQILSLGYLVYRSGNYFSNNTFKIGLPGASFKFITLHPEAIFHDLFKGFQPGMKLILDLD